MNYEKMTNEEINLAVARLLPEEEISYNEEGSPVRLEPNEAPAYTGIDFDEIPFEPCNSWADAGPLIQKYGIGLRKQASGKWCATQPGGGYPQYQDNPLRAAMIVFLMSKECK